MKYIIDILIAIINGTFILIAAIKGAGIVSRRTQMRKYSVELENRELNLRTAKRLLEHNFKSHLSQLHQQSDIHSLYDKSVVDYSRLVAEYNALITEINLYCGSSIQPKFFYPNFDEKTGTPAYEQSLQ